MSAVHLHLILQNAVVSIRGEGRLLAYNTEGIIVSKFVYLGSAPPDHPVFSEGLQFFIRRKKPVSLEVVEKPDDRAKPEPGRSAPEPGEEDGRTQGRSS